MKKLVTSLAALFAAAVLLSGQSLADATKLAKEANESLKAGDYATAITSFKDALKVAEACGEKGQELVDICKGIIPKTMNALAKKCLQAGDWKEALQQVRQSIITSSQYGNDEALANAEALIPQAYILKGKELMEAADFEAAAEAFKCALDADPTNGVAALRYGQALDKAGHAEEAVKALETAAENGQEKNAKALLGRHFLELATKAFNARKFADAVEAAVTSNSYVPSSYTQLLAGQASQLQGKNTDALMYYIDYLKNYPEATNAGEVAYTVAALYKNAGDKGKADEYMKKAEALNYKK